MMARLRSSKLVGEAATVLSGNVLAQGIALAAYFVLTRIYSPEDYGLFNIFYSYIEVLVIASTCKYELATVVADDDRQAAAVTRFALRLNTIVSCVLLAVAAALWLSGLLPAHFRPLGWMVMLIPPMVFFCGTSRIYSFVYNRYHRYRHIALSETVNAGGGALSKILLGLAGALPAGLPIGAVLGQAAANINYRLGLRKLSLPPTTAAERKAAARAHRNYPLFVAPKDFINTFSSNLPFLWAAAYFGRAEIGLFGLALTFTLQPVNLISSAIERVLYARTAEAVHSRQAIAPLLRRFVLPLAGAAVAVCVAAWFVAEPVFAFCFGSRWHGCGPYVQALLPWALAAFVSTSLLYLPNVFSVQRIELRFHIAMLLLRAAAIYIGIRMGSFLLTIRMFALASAAVHVALVVWYMMLVRRYSRSLD